MKHSLVAVIFFLGTNLYAQSDFNHEVSSREAKFTNITKNLEIIVDFSRYKHSSVKLIETGKDGVTKKSIIKVNTTLTIDHTLTKTFIIKHKKKFGFRFSQKIKETKNPKAEEKQPIPTPKTGRVRLDSKSAGGTITTTTVTST